VEEILREIQDRLEILGLEDVRVVQVAPETAHNPHLVWVIPFQEVQGEAPGTPGTPGLVAAGVGVATLEARLFLHQQIQSLQELMLVELGEMVARAQDREVQDLETFRIILGIPGSL
jgi:hypothetical protein